MENNEINKSMEKIFKAEYNNGQGPKELSALALAYVGDAVFEMLVRTKVLSLGNAPVNVLNKKARGIVNAKAQSDMYFRIEEFFTDEEKGVFRRGRNAKSHTVPKNADIMDYRHATGLESLFGYLYLCGNMERAIELFDKGMERK